MTFFDNTGHLAYRSGFAKLNWISISVGSHWWYLKCPLSKVSFIKILVSIANFCDKARASPIIDSDLAKPWQKQKIHQGPKLCREKSSSKVTLSHSFIAVHFSLNQPLGRFGLFWTILDQFELLGRFWTVLDSFGSFEPFWNLLGTF